MSMLSMMDEPTTMTPTVEVNGRRTVGEVPPVVEVRERVAGLRLKRVPSGALVAQVLGAVLFLAGLFWVVAVAWGLPGAAAVTMLTTGAASLILGTLREAKIL
jgi:predicted phage tail protein